MAPERLTRRSQGDAMVLAFEQRLADLGLDPLDRAAECGRAHMTCPGGAAEVERLRELDELA